MRFILTSLLMASMCHALDIEAPDTARTNDSGLISVKATPTPDIEVTLNWLTVPEDVDFRLIDNDGDGITEEMVFASGPVARAITVVVVEIDWVNRTSVQARTEIVISPRNGNGSLEDAIHKSLDSVTKFRSQGAAILNAYEVVILRIRSGEFSTVQQALDDLRDRRVAGLPKGMALDSWSPFFSEVDGLVNSTRTDDTLEEMGRVLEMVVEAMKSSPVVTSSYIESQSQTKSIIPSPPILDPVIVKSQPTKKMTLTPLSHTREQCDSLV